MGVSLVNAAGSAQRPQARPLDPGELALQPLVLPLLLGSTPVVPVRKVGALERVPLEVIHLPLGRHLPVSVVVPGDLVAVLADADDVVRRLRVGAGGLPGLPVVVGKDGVGLGWAGRTAQDLVGVVDALPVSPGAGWRVEEA